MLKGYQSLGYSLGSCLLQKMGEPTGVGRMTKGEYMA